MNLKYSKCVEINIWILALLFIVLLLISSFFLPDELKWNILAEILGIVITIILFSLILGWWKDVKIWRKVKGVVLDSIRNELQLIYMDISLFLEGGTVAVTSEEFEDNEKIVFYRILKERAEAPRFNLSDNALEFLKRNYFDDLFEVRRKNLDMLELKYSKFLDPEIIEALVSIEYCLYRGALNIKLFKDNKIDDEKFLSRFRQNLYQIIKDINKLHIESDLDIFFL